ncbi:unnamed protein product [Amoebophrya sp. A25]|nr:unnamed protein product [Amoebophrya sp. A25]|eukprot:GSA25T00005393001.1
MAFLAWFWIYMHAAVYTRYDDGRVNLYILSDGWFFEKARIAGACEKLRAANVHMVKPVSAGYADMDAVNAQIRSDPRIFKVTMGAYESHGERLASLGESQLLAPRMSENSNTARRWSGIVNKKEMMENIFADFAADPEIQDMASIRGGQVHCSNVAKIS